MNETDLQALLDPPRFTGRAGEQVRQFLAKEVAQALENYQAAEVAEVRV
jgi:hypothetical protein